MDGETGILTKPDAQDLADAAIGLLLDPARRVAMGAADGASPSASSPTSRCGRWWRATPS